MVNEKMPAKIFFFFFNEIRVFSLVFSIVGFNVGHYAPSQKVDTPYGRLVFLWEQRLEIFELYLTLLGQKNVPFRGR